jgi:hypothetical protein
MKENICEKIESIGEIYNESKNTIQIVSAGKINENEMNNN